MLRGKGELSTLKVAVIFNLLVKLSGVCTFSFTHIVLAVICFTSWG
jgi:hypothetical protein